jgi:hypothetical protein
MTAKSHLRAGFFKSIFTPPNKNMPIPDINYKSADDILSAILRAQKDLTYAEQELVEAHEFVNTCERNVELRKSDINGLINQMKLYIGSLGITGYAASTAVQMGDTTPENIDPTTVTDHNPATGLRDTGDTDHGLND